MINGINLIPEEIKRQWRLKNVRRVLGVVAVLYLAGLAALYMNQRREIGSLNTVLDELNARKASIAGQSEEYARVKAGLAEIRNSEVALNKRLELASGLAEDRVSWSYILKRLSNDIPPGVWLRSLATSDVGEGRKKVVRFLGSALTNRAVANFIFTLENCGYFRDVTLSYSQKRDFDSKTVFDFEISGELIKTEEVTRGW
jgi:Tfp pilus assembly protein PilN